MLWTLKETAFNKGEKFFLCPPPKKGGKKFFVQTGKNLLNRNLRFFPFESLDKKFFGKKIFPSDFFEKTEFKIFKILKILGGESSPQILKKKFSKVGGFSPPGEGFPLEINPRHGVFFFFLPWEKNLFFGFI